MVIRTDRCELHPDSFSIFRPPNDSFRTQSGQLGRLTEDQVKVSTGGERYFRTEAETRVAHVFGLHDVVRLLFRQDDTQRHVKPLPSLPFLCSRHSFRTPSQAVISPRPRIIHQIYRIRTAAFFGKGFL